VKVTVIGCGRLGAPYAVALVEIGHDVLGVEVDPAALQRLQLGSAQFNEPGLDEAIAAHHTTGRMRFTNSYLDAAAFADIHFVCVPTPQQQGELAADLTAVETAITTLAAHASRCTLIVGKSSIPVGTTARLGKLADQAAAPGVTVDVAWSPDFLRESTSLRDAAQPSRLIIGIPAGRSDIEQTIRTVWAPWLDTGVPLIVTDPATAELAKSAANAFLATKISFINAMAAICEAAGADIRTLSRSLALDPRIGPAMLDAGLGFGGSCIPKDIRALAARADELHVPEGRFLREVDAINIRRRRRVLALVRNTCGGDVTGKRIAVWGRRSSRAPTTSATRPPLRSLPT
jgi:UDPglucose 6-dehydrogenase